MSTSGDPLFETRKQMLAKIAEMKNNVDKYDAGIAWNTVCINDYVRSRVQCMRIIKETQAHLEDLDEKSQDLSKGDIVKTFQ